MPIRRTSNRSSYDSGFYNPEVYSDVGSRKVVLTWTPAQIATALWLDAANASTLTLVSGAVSTWSDLSGNARDATQTTASFRPAFASGLLNNAGGVRFDGINDFMQTSYTPGINTAVSIALVATSRETATASTVRVLFANSNAGAAQPGMSLTSSNGFASTTVKSLAIDSTNAGRFVRVNGSSASVTLSSSPFIGFASVTDQDSTASFWIGRFIDAVLPSHGFFDLFEVIMLTSAATSDIYEKLEGYLALKWGLTANLPNDHPYKN